MHFSRIYGSSTPGWLFSKSLCIVHAGPLRQFCAGSFTDFPVRLLPLVSRKSRIALDHVP